MSSATDKEHNGSAQEAPVLENGLSAEKWPETGMAVGTAFVPRKLRILMLGAGISGIQFAHDVTTQLTNFELEIYEKNYNLGGTWLENRYPGCACDVPAHTYQFSWEPNPRWSKYYAPAAEILAYLNNVTDKHDLRKYMHFNHRGVRAEWQEQSATWKVDIEKTDSQSCCSEVITRECDIFVQGTGVLNNWKWPDIDGLHDFKGQLLHTASWDASANLTGKTVAVIGNAASAVQCVAALQPNVKKLINYVRTPAWMLPHKFSGGLVQSDYTEEEKKSFETDDQIYYEHRLKLERILAKLFESMCSGSEAQRVLAAETLEHMKSKIKNKEILDALTPTFEIGCRRHTPADHYLHALQQDNVSLVTGGIVRVKGGYSLSENWGKDKATESYMAALVARFPNHFAFNPPICPVIGSLCPGIELASSYMLRVLHRVQIDAIRTFCVKDEAQTEFNEWAQSRMPHIAWAGTCRSWYKNSKGKVFVPWPGTMLHYAQTASIVRWEDFDLGFINPKNKYASLGNGITVEGFEPESVPWLRK